VDRADVAAAIARVAEVAAAEALRETEARRGLSRAAGT